MKQTAARGHLGSAVLDAVAITRSAPVSSTTVTDIYEAHADFVWASLHRLGVREADVPDMTQEVFVVVHRRLHTWDERTRITTWLFGICIKVAAGYRRRAWFRRERITETVEVGEHASTDQALTPEEQAIQSDARRRLQIVLDSLPPARRAVFVMFELEEKPCAEIAELFGMPVGTVHSRLHAARKDFRRGLERLEAQERRGRR